MQKHEDFSDIIVNIVENIEKTQGKYMGVLVIAQDCRGVRLKRVNTCGNCAAEVKLGGPPLAVLRSPVRTSLPSDSSADSLECSQARALDCCLKAS